MKTFVQVPYLFLVFGVLGCATNEHVNSHISKSFSARADADISDFTVSKAEFYNFQLMKSFDKDQHQIIKESRDKDTNGWVFTLDDSKKNFDRVLLHVNDGILKKRVFSQPSG